MSPGNPLACIRVVLALFALLVTGSAVAAASPRDVLEDYVPDGTINGTYEIRELTGALRLVRGREGDYESFADTVQMKIAEVLAGGHRSQERRTAAEPPPAAAPPAPAPSPPAASPPASPPPPPPGVQGPQEVVPPAPPAVTPVKPDDVTGDLPRLPERQRAARQGEIVIPSPPPVEPGDGPPWTFLLLTAGATLLAAGGLGAAGWRRLRRPTR